MKHVIWNNIYLIYSSINITIQREAELLIKTKRLNKKLIKQVLGIQSGTVISTGSRFSSIGTRYRRQKTARESTSWKERRNEGRHATDRSRKQGRSKSPEIDQRSKSRKEIKTTSKMFKSRKVCGKLPQNHYNSLYE